MAAAKFSEGQVLKAEDLNKVVDQANKIDAQEFTGAVTLKSTTGIAYTLTVTSAGLEIKKTGASSPAVTIKTDGSLAYARKKLKIVARTKPATNTTAYGGSTYTWSGIGTYEITDRGTVAGASITGSNSVKVFKEGSTYKCTIYNSNGSTVGTYTGSTTGVSFYCVSTCTVKFYADSASDVTCTFDGSADVVCDLSQIVAAKTMALMMDANSLPVSDEMSQLEPVSFSQLQEE